jgi:hypothetical protein
VVAWEAFAGRRLRQDTEDQAALMLQAVTQPPPRLRTLLPDLPQSVDDAVAAALTIDRTRRCPTAQRFAESLALAWSGIAAPAERGVVAEYVASVVGPKMAERRERAATAWQERTAEINASMIASPRTRTSGGSPIVPPVPGIAGEMREDDAHQAMKPGAVVTDRFVIEAEAGAGGMGRVYRAFDRVGAEIIALKVLTAEDGDNVDRFSREAQVLAKLSHPAVVRYVDHGVTAEGERYIAMEWLEGESLSQRLSRQPLTLAESVQVAQRVAQTLSEAHRIGIVHRDLKPSKRCHSSP